MLRRFAAFVLLAAVLIGCEKKKDDPANGGGGGGNGEPTPAGPAYTIKLRKERAGDKWAVTQLGTDIVTNVMNLSKGKQTNTRNEPFKKEFTETILEKPDGATFPTKMTQSYKVAEKGEPLKSLSYAGKTVTIEKKGATYSVTANGKRLPTAEEKTFRDMFENSAHVQASDLLPRKAVQVNEKWAIDPDVVRKTGVLLNLPINVDKSSGTGRLTRAYTKDDKQWGTIEITYTLVIDRGDQGVTQTGNITFSTRLDTPIDDSLGEWTKTIAITGKITTKLTSGANAEMTMDIHGTETRVPIQ